MNTLSIRLGFLSLAFASTLLLFSCEDTETATATIQVVEEYTASQGPVNQLRPIKGANLRIYDPQGSQHLETMLITDSQGKAEFTYEYDALLYVDVEYQGRMSIRNIIQLKTGETSSNQIILPE